MSLTLAAQLAASPMASAISLVAVNYLGEGERDRIIAIGKRFFLGGFYAGIFYAVFSIPEGVADSAKESQARALLWVGAVSLKTAIETGALAINAATAASIYNRFFPALG